MSSAASRGSRPTLFAVLTIVLAVSTALAQNPASAPPAANNPSQAGQQAPTGANEAPQTQSPISPESGTGDSGSMFVFKRQVEEVVLHATVFDEQRRLVSGLDRTAFTVLDGGVPQAITSFRREDLPVAMGIVIDNSGSMREKRDKINQAVMNFIRASNPQDQIFVVNFGQDPYLDQDFTSDTRLLQAALHQVSARGSTALYDAIIASAVHLRNSLLEKKVLLVITDGQDNMSRETLQEAAHRLQLTNGPTLYAVGLLGTGLESSGRDALQRLADGTGGVAYFPETLNEVDSITRGVARDIRNQYIIAYKPKNQNAKPGFQSVQVEAHAPGYGKLTVRTRSGYYPGQNTR